MNQTDEARRAEEAFRAVPLDDGAWCVEFLGHPFIADPEPTQKAAEWLVAELRKDYARVLADAVAQAVQMKAGKEAERCDTAIPVNGGPTTPAVIDGGRLHATILALKERDKHQVKEITRLRAALAEKKVALAIKADQVDALRADLRWAHEEIATLKAAVAQAHAAGRMMLKAADELMTEFVSKQRAADWGIINEAMVAMSKLLRAASSPEE